MEGLLYYELDSNCIPCNIWEPRHFVSFPFCGLKYLTTISDERNGFLKRNDCAKYAAAMAALRQKATGAIASNVNNNSNSNTYIPLDKDGSHTGWIFGGSLVVESIRTDSVVVGKVRESPSSYRSKINDDIEASESFVEMQLYPIVVNLKCNYATTAVRLAAVSEAERTMWIAEMKEEEARQAFISSSLDSRLAPSASLFEGLKDCESDIYINDVDFGANNNHIHCIMTFIHLKCPFGLLLQTISFNNCTLTDESLLHIAGLLHITPHLSNLSITNSKNIISSTGIKYIADSLPVYNQELTSINLTGNGLDDTGLAHLCTGLSGCKKLKFLNLSRNNLTVDSIKWLSSHIASYQMKSLSHFNLSHNNFGDDIVNFVANVTSCCPAAEYIDITYCKLASSGLTRLSQTALPSTLRFLDLCGIESAENVPLMNLFKAIFSHRSRYSFNNKSNSKRDVDEVKFKTSFLIFFGCSSKVSCNFDSKLQYKSATRLVVNLGGIAPTSSIMHSFYALNHRMLKLAQPYFPDRSRVSKAQLRRRVAWHNGFEFYIQADCKTLDSSIIVPSSPSKKPVNIHDNVFHGAEVNESINHRNFTQKLSLVGGTKMADVKLGKDSAPGSLIDLNSSSGGNPRSSVYMSDRKGANVDIAKTALNSRKVQDDDEKSDANTCVAIESFVSCKAYLPSFIDSPMDLLELLAMDLGIDIRQLYLVTVSLMDPISRFTSFTFSFRDDVEEVIYRSGDNHNLRISREFAQMNPAVISSILIENSRITRSKAAHQTVSFLNDYLQQICRTSESSIRRLGITSVALYQMTKDMFEGHPVVWSFAFDLEQSKFPRGFCPDFIPNVYPSSVALTSDTKNDSGYSTDDDDRVNVATQFEEMPVIDKQRSRGDNQAVAIINDVVDIVNNLGAGSAATTASSGVGGVGSAASLHSNSAISKVSLIRRERQQQFMDNREKILTREQNELLISAIRRLFIAGEISSSIAKFWEGACGNEKFIKHYHLGLTQAYESKYSEKYFKAAAIRDDLFNAMSSRDVGQIYVHLNSFKRIGFNDDLDYGVVITLASRLLSEILSLQRDAQAILLGGVVVSNLFVVDQLLLRFAATGYSGEEVSLILQYKQKLIKKMSQDLPNDFNVIVNVIKYRSKICNLLMSRDFDGLAECLAEIELLGRGDTENDIIKSEEYALACHLKEESMALDSQIEEHLRDSFTDKNKMEDSVAWICYRNFPSLSLAKLKKKILSSSVDVELTLMAPLLASMRKSDNFMVEKAIMMCFRAGWKHDAFRGHTITSILESKVAVIEDESIKTRLTKSALSILNGIENNLKVTDVLYLLRKANSSKVGEDSKLQKYIEVCKKFCKKHKNEAAVDGAIQKMIDDKNINELVPLLAGRGTRRMVVSAESAQVMQEWINNIEDVCKGRYNSLVKKENENNPSNNSIQLMEGFLEKAPVSAVGRNSLKGWKKRYFIINGSHFKYFATPISNEPLGEFYMVGGHVNKLSLFESNNKPYCFEVCEGRDLQFLDSNKLEDAKKIISQARSATLIKSIIQAIQNRDEIIIRQCLQDARDLNYFLDYELYRAAKYCLVQIAMGDLEKQLEWVLVDIPSEKLIPLRNMCLSLNFDYKNALYISLNRLLACSESEFAIIRLANAMMINHETRFIKNFNRLSRIDLKSLSPQNSVCLASVIVLHAGRRAYRSYLDGDSYKNILKILTLALACANSLMVETEGMHLARLTVTYFAKLHAMSQRNMPGNSNNIDLDAIESHASKSNQVAISVSNYMDIMKSEIGINQKLTIDKYPHLRTKASLKSSFLDIFNVFNSSSSVPGKKGENKIVSQFLSYSPDRLRSSLLLSSSEVEELAAIEIFDGIRAIVSFDDDSTSDILRFNKKNMIFQKKLKKISEVYNEMIPHLQKHPILADELFIQLAKQLTNNTDYELRERYWITFALFLQLVRPSNELLPYLKNYMYTAAGLESYQLTKYDSIRKRSSRLSQDRVRNRVLELTELKRSVVEFTIPTNRAMTPDELKLVQMREEMALEMDCVQSILVLIAYNLRLLMSYDESAFSMKPKKEKKKKTDVVKYSNVLPHGLITRVISRRVFNVDIVLMTGSVYRFPVRFGDVPNMYSFLPMLYERIMGGCDILRTIAVEQGIFKPGMSSNAWMDWVISIFRGFSFYLSDDLEVRDKSNIKLGDIPTQSSISSHIAWNADIVWKILEIKDSEDARKEKKTRKKGFLGLGGEEVIVDEGPDPSDPNSPADITLLFRKQTASAAEKFEDMNKVFRENIADCDILRNQASWRTWLKDDIAPMPSDHVKIDLLFAEEVKYVNTRLYPCTDDVFSYLVGLQLALERWIDFGNPDKEPTSWGSDRCHRVLEDSSMSVRPIYFKSPQETKRILKRRHELKRRRLGRDDANDHDDDDDIDDNDFDDNEATETASIYSKSTVFSYNVFNKTAHASYIASKHVSASETTSVVDERSSARRSPSKGSRIQQHSYFHREMARVDARNRRRRFERNADQGKSEITNHFDNDDFTIAESHNFDNEEEEYGGRGGGDDDDDDDSSGNNRSVGGFGSPVSQRCGGLKGGSPHRGDDDESISSRGSDDSDSDYVDEFHEMVGVDRDDASFDSLNDSFDNISVDSDISGSSDGGRTKSGGGGGGNKSRRSSQASDVFEEPNIATSLDNIREGDMILIRNKLLLMGLDYDINSSMIKLIAHWLLLFHRIAVNEIVSIDSHNYRYLIKRAYLEYLAGCPFYGHHFSQATLLNAGNGEVVDVVVTISTTGVNMLDQITWETIYTAPLWDIDNVSVSNPNDDGDNGGEGEEEVGETKKDIADNRSATGRSDTGRSVKSGKSNSKSETKSEAKPPNSTCLLLTINDQTLVLKSDYAVEMQELLQRCVLEALGQGIFPRGKDYASIFFSSSYSKFLNHILPNTSVSSAGSLSKIGRSSSLREDRTTALATSNSIYNYHDIYLPGVEFSIHHFEAYQQFLHSCTLLPIPPIICSTKFNTTDKMIFRGENSRQRKFYEDIKLRLDSEQALNDLASKRMQELEDNMDGEGGGGEGGGTPSSTPAGTPALKAKPVAHLHPHADKSSESAVNNVPFSSQASDNERIAGAAELEKDKLKTIRLIIEYSACGQPMPFHHSHGHSSSRTAINVASTPRRIQGHWVRRNNDSALSSDADAAASAASAYRKQSINSIIHVNANDKGETRIAPSSIDKYGNKLNEMLGAMSKKIELPLDLDMGFGIESKLDIDNDSDYGNDYGVAAVDAKLRMPVTTSIARDLEDYCQSRENERGATTSSSSLSKLNDGGSKIGGGGELDDAQTRELDDDAAKMGIVLPIFEPHRRKRATIGVGESIYSSTNSGVVRGRCSLLTQYLKEKEREKRGNSVKGAHDAII